MKAPLRLPNFLCGHPSCRLPAVVMLPLLFLLLVAMPQGLRGQVLTWDLTPGTPGVQNGSGTWNTTVANWIDASNNNVQWTNSGLEVAQFGSTTPVNPSVVTLASSVSLKGLTFLALGAGTPVSGFQYLLNGQNPGTVMNFGDGGVIEMADYSSGGSQFAALGANLAIQGSNLTVRKTAGSGSVTQFLNLNMASNPNLTGTLTIGSYIYLGVTSLGTIANVSNIVVQNNGTLTLGSTGSEYTMGITAAGYNHAYTAIRIIGSNTTLSGGITMTGDMGILMHSSNTGLLINAAITDGGMGYGLYRSSLTKADGTMTLTAANTYSGKTTIGRNLAGYTGGITILDFAGKNAQLQDAPEQDILYNGVATAGGLEFAGTPIATTISGSFLVLNGKAGAQNSQRFGNLSLSGLKSEIQLISGAGGSMTMSLGTISRTGASMISFIGPAQGSITTTTAEGFLGPWATYKTGAGVTTWAQVSGGAIAGFSGSTAHVTGVAQASDTNTHLSISGSSVGVVTPSATVTQLGTVSMTDTIRSRTLLTGSGNTLRLGAVGGVQIASDAKSLTIGELGVTSSLSAGGTVAGTTGQLYLTNNSTTSLLTIHSGIVNNAGGGAVSVFLNGVSGSTTVLTGTGSYTGGTTLASGALEIRNGAALGTTGTIVAIDGTSLRFAGGITFNRAVTISGLGTPGAVDGALRNVSGDNTLSGLITILAPSSIVSDSGTLRLQAASATANAVTGSFNLTIGGRANTIVDGRIAIGTGILTKTGNGTLILAGDNTFTGTVSINAGILRPTHANALGSLTGTYGVTTINIGGTLEMMGGLTLGAEPINLASVGVNGTGGIRNTSGDNTLTGAITIVNTARIESQSGTLTLDVASGSAIIKDNSASNRALTFGGSGNIVVLDAISRQNTGALAVTKEGTGTLTLKALSTYDGTTTVSSGEVHLDFTELATPTNLLYNGSSSPGTLSMAGGTLKITAKSASGVTTTQAFGSLAIGAGQSTLRAVQNGAAAVTVQFGNITRGKSGGVLEFIAQPDVADTTGTGGAITYNTIGGQDNTIISHDGITSATWGKSDWAATAAKVGDRRRIVGLSSIAGGYTASTATSLAGNADVVLGTSTVSLSATTNITSLRFNAAQTSFLNIATGATLVTGGILVGEGVGARTTYISGGTLRSPSTGADFDVADLVVIQNNTLGDLVISSVIGNNFAASPQTSFTKSGAGTVVFETVTHTYTGTTYVTDGTLHLKSGAISPATQFTLGGGGTSGKLKVGSNTQAMSLQGDWLRIQGIGTQNSLVGGGSFMASFLLDTDNLTSDFRRGIVGGSGEYENNISLGIAATGAILQLGSSNTYAGKTIIYRGIMEVETLADAGQVSSLGTGNFGGDPNNAVIDIASQTTTGTPIPTVATLRYVGSTNSVTNRALRLINTDNRTDIPQAVAVLENTGTGTVKFTSRFLAEGGNDISRVLRLSGTNTGANEIVGISDVSTSVKTEIEKTGTGTWGITGDNTYSGGTTVSAGTLQALNAASVGSGTGSATGMGNVVVAAGATLSGNGRIAPGIGSGVTVNGIVSVGDATLATAQASKFEIATTGSGVLTFKSGSSLVLDIFGGLGGGDNTANPAAADLMVINGSLTIETGTTLVLNNPSNLTEWVANDSWKLFDWSGMTGRTGEFAVLSLPALGGGLSWDTSKLYLDGIIAVTVVPEPGRGLLVLIASLAVGMRRRR